MFKKTEIMEKIDFEFLPDIVAITEKPDSPLGSAVVWLISSLVTIALIISIVCKIDTVASAKGKIVPKGKLHVIVTPDAGVIEKIHVKEGQKIKKGDKLLSFDSDVSQGDLSDTQKLMDIQVLEKLLLEHEKNILNELVSPLKLNNFSHLDNNEVNTYVNQMNERVNEYRNRLYKESLGIQQKENEKQMTNLTLNNLLKKEILLKQDLANMKKQLKAGLISEFNVDSKELEYNTTKEEINIQKLRVETIIKFIEESKQGIVVFKNEKINWLTNEIITREKNIDSLKNKLLKDTKKQEFQELRAPLNGTINKINTNNSGGFVGQGQELITIVPEESVLEAEVYISNKDIGFVRTGQNVKIKLDTFPFQDYGNLEGVVKLISPDSEMIEGNLYYKAAVRITENKLKVPKEQNKIIPGMSLIGDIQTEKRRIIDFFLSPFKKSMEESLKLR